MKIESYSIVKESDQTVYKYILRLFSKTFTFRTTHKYDVLTINDLK